MKLERKSSIESEPRTLTLEQLQYAREAALNVLNTKTLEEAASIFTEGLQPVLSIRQRRSSMVDLADESEELDHIAASDWRLPPPPFLTRMRDIVSSPF